MRGQDTNILVYALAAQDEEKRRIAANILGGAVEDPNDYAVFVQVLAETICGIEEDTGGAGGGS